MKLSIYIFGLIGIYENTDNPQHLNWVLSFPNAHQTQGAKVPEHKPLLTIPQKIVKKPVQPVQDFIGLKGGTYVVSLDNATFEVQSDTSMTTTNLPTANPSDPPAAPFSLDYVSRLKDIAQIPSYSLKDSVKNHKKNLGPLISRGRLTHGALHVASFASECRVKFKLPSVSDRFVADVVRYEMTGNITITVKSPHGTASFELKVGNGDVCISHMPKMHSNLNTKYDNHLHAFYELFEKSGSTRVPASQRNYPVSIVKQDCSSNLPKHEDVVPQWYQDGFEQVPTIPTNRLSCPLMGLP